MLAVRRMPYMSRRRGRREWNMKLNEVGREVNKGK